MTKVRWGAKVRSGGRGGRERLAAVLLFLQRKVRLLA